MYEHDFQSRMAAGKDRTKSDRDAEQAAHVAKKAARWLPGYQRVALERMYDPATRARDNLN
jgi:hypothetical protein